MSISDVYADYARIRYENEQKLRDRVAEAYSRVPMLKELHQTIHLLLAERLRLAINGQAADEEKLQTLRVKEKVLLKSAGFCEDYLSPIYDCKECQDTGLLSDATHCACFKKRMLEDKLASARLLDDNVSFDKFNLDIFDDSPIANGKSQRDAMQKCRAITLKYADDFPSCSPILVLSGGIGLGKTYVSKCIMRRVIERGYTAGFYTAYRLFSMFHADRLGEDVDLNPLFEVPLLIVDDLGTEPMTKNVTIEYFFDLLNERLSAGRHTIFVTNLELHDLNARYGERIHSRLMDSRFSQKIIFKGKDVRY